MTPAKDKARANKTFIVQASLVIITYNRHNIFTVQASGALVTSQACLIFGSIQLTMQYTWLMGR
jgi:hypothetical protein